jgi:hypothetical protein
MAYQPMKSESYQNLGGINSKISPYDNSMMEFRDISNMDFFIPGSLQERQGTGTFIIGTSFTTGVTLYPGPIGGLYEFAQLEGNSYIMFSQGTSNLQTGLFFVNSYLQNYLQYNEFVPSTINGITNLTLAGITYPINNKFSFTSFVDRLFFCNGDVFQKWSGTTFTYTNYNYSGIVTGTLPVQNVSNYSLPAPVAKNFTLNIVTSSSILPFTNINWVSFTLTYSFAYINERNFVGPVSGPLVIGGITNFATGHTFQIITITDLSNPYVPGYGIYGTSGNLYDYNPFQATPGTLGVFRDNGPGTNRTLLFSVPIYPGASVITSNSGFYGPGVIAADDPLRSNYAGITNTFNLGDILEPTCISPTLAPQFIDVFNNQLFALGFSNAPSTVQFSDIGEPESVQPESNFDVRTNDGDYLTGKKNFQFNFYFFKKNSFHQLSGTDPSNFQLVQVSSDYGCLSDKAIVIYNTNHMLFLDRKGIVDFNGAFASVVSEKVEPIFLSMNIPSAIGNAWGLHNKQFNQVWWGIPVNGSTMINKIVVYDYLINAWTHFDGLFPACAAMCIADQPYQTPYIGGYSGVVAHFGSSFTSDMGNAITFTISSRYHSDMGQSTEKQYRRLFLNQESATGQTMSWAVDFFQDYGTSLVYSTTMVSQLFQNRIDFGIPAKGLQFELIGSSSTDIVRLHGYTIESRYQRSV